MKVLQVIASLDRGGAETLLVNILENIHSQDVEFDFLVYGSKKYDYEDKILEMGGKIIRMENPMELGMLNFIKKLTKMIKNNKYDVVHAHTLFNCGPVMLAAFLARVKTRISHSHNTQILEEEVKLKKKIYFFLSKILINMFSTSCLACGKEAGKFLYYQWKKFSIISNGVLVEKYAYNKECRKKIRNKYNIAENDLVIGNIGRLNFQKNQTFLINIFIELLKIKQNSYLIILGDGELRDSLHELAKTNNVESQIIFTGNVSNAYEYYSSFDVFVFPSNFEGLPYTLIEAQCNGVPIIASSVISEECNLTNQIIFEDLAKSPYDWALKILENSDFNNRYSKIDDIIESGYSILDTVEKIIAIYKK